MRQLQSALDRVSAQDHSFCARDIAKLEFPRQEQQKNEVCKRGSPSEEENRVELKSKVPKKGIELRMI